jgi:cell division inhibitor SepF
MYSTNTQNEEEYVEEGTSLGARLKDWFGRFRDREEDYEDDHEGETTSMREETTTTGTTFGTAPMRVSRVREQAIHVLSAANFTDIQKAADGLKQGIPQVINLEKADSVMAERLKDFMNGVTYALDGYVEKISDKAYLFTPRTVEIKTEPTPGSLNNTRTPFFDTLKS